MKEWTMPMVEELEVQETKSGAGVSGTEEQGRTPNSQSVYKKLIENCWCI